MHSCTVLQFLELRHLALKAIEPEPPENLQGLRIKTNDFTDGHFFGYHLYFSHATIKNKKHLFLKL
jgi:hypothetical protein